MCVQSSASETVSSSEYYDEEDDPVDAASQYQVAAPPPYVPVRSYDVNKQRFFSSRGGVGNNGHQHHQHQHQHGSAFVRRGSSSGLLDLQPEFPAREEVREWHGGGGYRESSSSVYRRENYHHNNYNDYHQQDHFIIMSNESGADAERALKTPPNPGHSDGGNTNTGAPFTAGGGPLAMASGENGPASQVSGLQTTPSNGTFGAPSAAASSGAVTQKQQQQQQQQAGDNSNNNSSGQKEANESEPAPPPPLPKPKPLIKSKASVSPLHVKRAAAANKPTTPIRDTNGNGNFDGSPPADGDFLGPTAESTGNGPTGGIRQPTTNPNAPTRVLGGIKPRKGGGWKARPDSESFALNNLSPTDDDESVPVVPRTVNVNPVITTNVVVNRSKIGSSGGGAIGGGGRGGWGANQRRTSSSRVQSPSGAVVQPIGSGAAPVPPSMDIQSDQSSSQPQTTPVHPALSLAARTPSRTDLSFDNIPGPSGLLPHNPGVPGTIGGNPQSRYSNLSFWKARRVLFYRNGDPFFPGVEFRFKPGRDICTLEALQDKISARMDLPRGARYIFSMDGDRKYSLDELEDGSSYVVSSFKVFKVSAPIILAVFEFYN